MNCSECAFSQVNEFDDGTLGLSCWRYPPQTYLIDGEPVQIHPAVDDMTWCGEFTPAVKPAVQL